MTNRQRKRPGLGGTRAAVIGKRNEAPDTAVTHRRQHHAMQASLRALDAEAAGLIQVETLGLDGIAAHADRDKLMRAILHWHANGESGPLFCLCCEHQWRSPDQTPPAAFTFLRPWRSDARMWSVSGLCAACAVAPGRDERIIDIVKAIWPNARSIGRPHLAPGRVQ